MKHKPIFTPIIKYTSYVLHLKTNFEFLTRGDNRMNCLCIYIHIVLE
jgi:hypothetical protein